MSRASQPVLVLPELLSRILQFLDDEDYSSTALVCKTWSEQSLNILWDDVGPEKIPTLFKLLGPVAWGSNDLFVFVRPLQTEDWSRFDQYARRVHGLACNQPFMDELDPSFWSEISSTRPHQYLFPHLQRLLCTPQPDIISFLAPNDLRTMTLVGFGTHFTPITLQETLIHVQSRMKSLQNFTLAIDEFEFDKLAPILPELLRGFSNIRRLKISQGYLTPAVIDILSSFPHLESIEGSQHQDIRTGMFPASLKEGSFPSLESLSACAPFSGIVPCLVRLGNLAHLTLTSFEPESTAVYGQIILAIASALPKLEALALITSDIALPPPEAHEIIKFSALAPLLSLHQLKSIALQHYFCPFDLSCNNVISILQALPHLEELLLNPCPLFDPDPTLDSTDLLKITPYCQQLKTLGLYWDLRMIPATYEDAASLPSLASFVHGASRLAPDVAPVTAFLGHMLPDGCELLWCHQGIRGQWDGQWDEVERRLPVFRQARKANYRQAVAS